jgi:hypothetical protein
MIEHDTSFRLLSARRALLSSVTRLANASGAAIRIMRNPWSCLTLDGVTHRSGERYVSYHAICTAPTSSIIGRHRIPANERRSGTPLRYRPSGACGDALSQNLFSITFSQNYATDMEK